MNNQPINQIKWIHRDKLKANNYNPNHVAKPELTLLMISILEDGWTQPIVVIEDDEKDTYIIVDGFHRYTVSGNKKIYSLTDGMVPVVIIKPKDDNHKMMSTIRHNRARGTHHVLKMAEIVKQMIQSNLSMQEIGNKLQMESEEVIRLANRVGIPKSKIIQDKEFSNAWIPE